jgi:hypothetical protein
MRELFAVGDFWAERVGSRGDLRVEYRSEDAWAGFELHPDAIIAGRGELIRQINGGIRAAGSHVMHAVIHAGHISHASVGLGT